ncbi:hypothetical protein [Frigidibacter sp. ROC022]|uniref:hypothetical protein n=1 Tax=Frigidibacter sp. ROC022 TaxID=2971796 RepID=UPI00215B7539|nr:hypothetical protein [Frigidibacter sp. ROC022]MCR8724498.1 hypothetical protein [Frigidibacter sp. ROC022]
MLYISPETVVAAHAARMGSRADDPALLHRQSILARHREMRRARWRSLWRRLRSALTRRTAPSSEAPAERCDGGAA